MEKCALGRGGENFSYIHFPRRLSMHFPKDFSAHEKMHTHIWIHWRNKHVWCLRIGEGARENGESENAASKAKGRKIVVRARAALTENEWEKKKRKNCARDWINLPVPFSLFLLCRAWCVDKRGLWNWNGVQTGLGVLKPQGGGTKWMRRVEKCGRHLCCRFSAAISSSQFMCV